MKTVSMSNYGGENVDVINNICIGVDTHTISTQLLHNSKVHRSGVHTMGPIPICLGVM